MSTQTIPNRLATTGHSGEMSADDKTKVDRLGVRIALVDLAAVTGYTATAWAAGLYSKLWYRLTETTVSGATQVKASLTGLSASYVSNQLYQSSPLWLVEPYASALTTAWAIGTTAAGGTITGEIGIRTGGPRQSIAREIVTLAPISQSKFEGFNTDTSHDVTGIVFDFGATTVTGKLEIWGWP